MTQGITNTFPLLRILPELVFTLTGVLVMLVDATLPKQSNRKPLGWITVLGALLALGASFLQLTIPAGTAFFGTLQTDNYSIFFHILICSIVLVSSLVAIDCVKPDTENLGELFALMALGAVGSLLMTSAVELLLVFIALEISSIATYVLAGFRRRNAKCIESSIKYFLLGSFATAFFLYGIALTYGATGTTRITEIAADLATSHTLPLAVVGLAFMLVGLLFKISAAPFHIWTPDAYEGAPSPIVGLMSTAPKVAGVAVLLRVAFEAFPSMHFHWQPILWVIAALSMTIGNLGALRQRSVKRMLAYSSIAHAGYLLVAFAALSTEGIAAACFYAVTYAAMNVGIFAVISHVGGYEDRLTTIDDYRGLMYRCPLLGGAMCFFLFSLIGIPFTGGFFGKFFVFSTALHSGLVWLAIIGLLNSGIAVFYYLRVLLATCTKPAEDAPIHSVGRPSFALLVALVLTVGITLILGIIPNRVIDMAQAGAQTLAQVNATPASCRQMVATTAVNAMPKK